MCLHGNVPKNNSSNYLFGSKSLFFWHDSFDNPNPSNVQYIDPAWPYTDSVQGLVRQNLKNIGFQYHNGLKSILEKHLFKFIHLCFHRIPKKGFNNVLWKRRCIKLWKILLQNKFQPIFGNRCKRSPNHMNGNQFVLHILTLLQIMSKSNQSNKCKFSCISNKVCKIVV